MCKIKNCGCNSPTNPVICVSYQANESCEDRKLVASNTTDSQGHSGVTIITPEVNQISAFKDHLEFVNSTEPLSGIKKHTVIRIAQSFIDSITGLISNFIGRNVGLTGAAEIYKGSATVGSNIVQDFRKIAGSPSIDVEQIGDNIVPSVDEVWLQEQFPDIPTVDYPVINGNSIGAGIPLFKGLNAKKLDIATLTTTNLSMTVNPDGGLNIDTPESGSTTTGAYYVNKNYNPTSSTPSNGTIARPYKTLTEAVTRYIGTGTRLDPNPLESGKNTITLLSDIDDSIDPTINGLTFRLEGNVKYKYTGSNTYIFNMLPIYNAAGLPLTRDVGMTIQGEGIITRSTGFGHIQNENATSNGATYMSLIRIENEGEGLRFVENENYGAYTPLTSKGGGPLLNGGIVSGANIAPTTPMFNIIGDSPKYWGIDVSGPMCTIQTMSQVGIRVTGGKFYSHNISGIKVQISTNYISYQPSGRVEDYVDGTLTRDVYYTPYSGRNNYEFLNGSQVQIDSLSFGADAPTFTNVNSIFKITNGSVLNIVNDVKAVQDVGAVSFIDYSGTDNIVYINNGNIISACTYFIKGDTVNTLGTIFKNTSANNILSTTPLHQTNTTTINTDGTFSSVRGRAYITGIPGDYTDNTDALAALGKNVLYTSLVGGRVSLNITR